MHNRSIYFPHFNSDQRSKAANRHVTDLSLMHLRDTEHWLSNTIRPIGANYGPTNTWSRTSADAITSQVGGNIDTWARFCHWSGRRGVRVWAYRTEYWKHGGCL